MSNKFETLTEIKKGQVGSGLLIESEGYIDLSVGDNKKRLTEAFEKKGELGPLDIPEPLIVNAIFQKFGVENANGRIYQESVLKREVDRFIKEKINTRMALMELNHPSDSSVNLERVAGNIIELHWEGHTLCGQIEIGITRGYYLYGMCTTLSDLVADHILHGYRIGVSSRALGSVTQSGGCLLVGSDLELICWDYVSFPSTPGSFISQDVKALEGFKESTKKDDNKLMTENRFDKFNGWLFG